MSEMIQTLKYRRGLWLVPDLVEMLAGLVEVEFAGIRLDVVVPVPLHGLRRRERGFNQSALLGSGLAKRLKLAYIGRAVRRRVATLTQTHLTAEERMSNVSEAFEVHRVDWVRDRSLLLVDDVITTGATMFACAEALRRAGAAAVYAVSVARG
jgi:ComF family protein